VPAVPVVPAVLVVPPRPPAPPDPVVPAEPVVPPLPPRPAMHWKQVGHAAHGTQPPSRQTNPAGHTPQPPTVPPRPPPCDPAAPPLPPCPPLPDPPPAAPAPDPSDGAPELLHPISTTTAARIASARVLRRSRRVESTILDHSSRGIRWVGRSTSTRRRPRSRSSVLPGLSDKIRSRCRDMHTHCNRRAVWSRNVRRPTCRTS